MKFNFHRPNSAPVHEETWTSFHRKHGSKKDNKLSPTKSSCTNTRGEVHPRKSHFALFDERKASFDEQKRRARLRRQKLEEQQKRHRKLFSFLDRITESLHLYTTHEKVLVRFDHHGNIRPRGVIRYERPIFGRRKHGDFEDEALMFFEEQDPDKLYPAWDWIHGG